MTLFALLFRPSTRPRLGRELVRPEVIDSGRLNLSKLKKHFPLVLSLTHFFLGSKN